jgi:hypothetical protein
MASCLVTAKKKEPNMKKLLLILLFPLNCFAGTVWYVSTSGNDVSGNGTFGNPWRTPNKACHTVDGISVGAPGDTIHVLSGTYNELKKCDSLAAGISIQGETDMSSILTFTRDSVLTYDACIQLASAFDGTPGDQSISFLEISGNSIAARSCITVMRRSNVKIFNCYIHDFLKLGIFIKGADGSTNLATGNEIYNCNIYNCSDRYQGNTGLIQASGYDGLLIHDNILVDTSRALGHNGNIYSPNYDNYAKNFKWYNNKSYKLPYEDNIKPSFHLEMWDAQGGMEIYNNEFHGGQMLIDLGGNAVTKGASTYSFYIHDNLFIQAVQYATKPALDLMGINIEGDAEYIVITNNHFKKCGNGIHMTLNHTSSTGMVNVVVRNNLFDSCGFIDGTDSHDVGIGPSASSFGACLIRDIYIDNNTMVNVGSRAGFSFDIPSLATARNLRFRNNIVENIVNFGYVTIGNGAGDKDSIYLQNNISFNNNHSNDTLMRSGATKPTTVIGVNTVIKLNPVLNSDYTLGIGSPAFNAGLNIGLPFLGSQPDIGAFEAIPPLPPAGTYIKVWGNYKFIN